MATIERKRRVTDPKPDRREEEEETVVEGKTSIQLTAPTRDRLYRLKFRRTYDQFVNELCDLYEREMADKS
jgi:hypothetical protein